MAIQSRDQLINALGNSYTYGLVDKASVANTAIGLPHALWRATGTPGQGAIPAAAAVCNNVLLGAIPFAQQVAPNTSYLAVLEALAATAGVSIEVSDRLMHMGGLNGTLTTAQTVGIDLSANLGVSNLLARIGAPTYDAIGWFLDWYTDTGATGVNCTVNVTYNDAVTANLAVQALPATVRATRRFPLNGLIPAADGGRGGIRAVNNVTLSATTGAVGNFGVTATASLASIYCPVASARFKAHWADLGLPQVHNGACLELMMVTTGTASGILRGVVKIIHG